MSSDEAVSVQRKLFTLATIVLEDAAQSENEVAKMLELVLSFLSSSRDAASDKCHVEVTYWQHVFLKVQIAVNINDIKLICKQYVCVPYTTHFNIANSAMKAAINLMTKKIYKFKTSKPCACVEDVQQGTKWMTSLLTEIAAENGETLEGMMSRVEIVSK